MPLVPGERIDAGNRAAYVVDGVIDSTPFGTRYRARKIFFNFRFSDKEFYEAAEDEWVAVQIRCAEQGTRSDANDARLIRELLEYEAGAVLGNFPAWFPEPLDWLEHAGQRLLITSQSHGESLRAWRNGTSYSPARAVRAAGEILNMLEAIHLGEHSVGAIGPDDFTIDPTGRISFLATDRVLPIARVAGYRSVFPPDRYPSAFAAPEVLDARGSFDAAQRLVQLVKVDFGAVDRLCARGRVAQCPWPEQWQGGVAQQPGRVGIGGDCADRPRCTVCFRAGWCTQVEASGSARLVDCVGCLSFGRSGRSPRERGTVSTDWRRRAVRLRFSIASVRAAG